MSQQLTILENGLRIVTDTIPSVQTAALGLWVDAGARHEQVQENGIAHFLEHMAFKGTDTRSAKEIAETIESVGGYLNAYTAREVTAYHARILKEDVHLSIDLIADIIQNSTFDGDELEKERDVIIQEIGQSNDTPDDVIFDYFQELCYPNQAMGRPILGTVDTVNSFKASDIRSFISNNYHPSKMVFSASGNIDHTDIVSKVTSAFTKLPQAAAIAPTATSYQGGIKVIEKDLEQVHTVLGFPGIAHGKADYFTASVLATVLGGGMSSRLFQEVREKRGLVYSIYAFHSGYRDAGQFGIYAGTGAHQVAELMPTIYHELKTFAATVSDQEVNRAKTQLIASLMMGAESTSARCDQAARQTLTYGKPLGLKYIQQAIAAISKNDVIGLAEKLFCQPTTLVAYGPLTSIDTF